MCCTSVSVADTGKRTGKHLNMEERRKIAMLHYEGRSMYYIGKVMGRSRQTIKNELERGTATLLIKGAFEKKKYFPDTGQAAYEKHRKNCQSALKIGKCKRFIAHVEEEALKKKRSFDAICGRALREGLFAKEEMVCATTLYAYADRRLIKVRNIDLPEKVSRRKKKEPLKRQHKRLYGRSIESRPKEVDKREEFGNWEIDLVVGKKTGDSPLLTLVERKTRKVMVEKLEGKSAKEVEEAMGRIWERTPFPEKVFRSITSDNGSEFSRLYEQEAKGTKVYYAHPYSAWERGANENGNRIIRRFIPKGRAIRGYTEERLREIEMWINTLARRILGYATAEEMWEAEIERLKEEEERAFCAKCRK